MDTPYLLPSAVVGTVGTMYTIFVAIAVFSAKYFDSNARDMKQIVYYFLVLSVVVYITILLNGYILYLQSGGDLISNLQILANLFPKRSYLRWSLDSFVLTVTYIFLFSFVLLYTVFIRICSVKKREITQQEEKHNEKIKKLKILCEHRNKKLLEFERKADSLTTSLKEFIIEDNEKHRKLKEKVDKILEKKTIKSEIVVSEIEKMLDIKKESSEQTQDPFYENIQNAKKIERTHGIPEDLLQVVKEYREGLETLNNQHNKNLTLFYELEQEKDKLLKYISILEKRGKMLEKEKEDIRRQIEELNNVFPMVSTIQRLILTLKEKVITKNGS